MRKLIAAMLLMVMVLSLFGCSVVMDPPPENVRGDISTAAPTQSPTEPTPGFSLGQTEDNVYKNDFLGMTCTLPADWTFYTDEQILELNNIVVDTMNDDVAQMLENATIVYDMYAMHPTEGSSINVNLEKFTGLQILAMDIKQVLESQIEAIRSTYQNMGLTDIEIQYQKVTVDGKEFDSLKISGNMQGVGLYATCFAFKKGTYLANVSVCTIAEDKTADILACITIK